MSLEKVNLNRDRPAGKTVRTAWKSGGMAEKNGWYFLATANTGSGYSLCPSITGVHPSSHYPSYIFSDSFNILRTKRLYSHRPSAMIESRPRENRTPRFFADVSEFVTSPPPPPPLSLSLSLSLSFSSEEKGKH